MTVIFNINKAFKNIKLEQRLIQIFASFTASFFLNELLFLGNEYFFKYPESLNLELTQGTFYLKHILGNRSLVNKTFIFRNSLILSEIFIKQTSFTKYNIITKHLYKLINPISTSLFYMIVTGSKANLLQAEQLIGSRGFITNIRNYTTKIPILKNFITGLNIVDYVISSYGTRRGILDTSIKTSETGYLTRRMIESLQDIIIKEEFCGTNINVRTDLTVNCIGTIILSELDILKNKFLINSNCINKNLFLKLCNIYINNTLLTEIFNYKNITIIYSKAPIVCNSGRSICNKCMGFNFQKKLIPNESIGIITGESLGEPGTQLTLRTFHTGGILGTHSFKSYNNTTTFYNLKFLYTQCNIRNKYLGIYYNKIYNFKQFKVSVLKKKYLLKPPFYINKLYSQIFYKKHTLNYNIINFKNQFYIKSPKFKLINSNFNILKFINEEYNIILNLMNLLIQNYNKEWLLLNVSNKYSYISNVKKYYSTNSISFKNINYIKEIISNIII